MIQIQEIEKLLYRKKNEKNTPVQLTLKNDFELFVGFFIKHTLQ